MISGLFNYFAACSGGSFLGFPTWYKYLNSVQVNDQTGSGCIPKITGLNDIWLILAAVIEILLRIAALAAIGFVIYGGIQYIMSQGNPDKTQKARSTIIDALVGLVIAISATALITFVAGRIR